MKIIETEGIVLKTMDFKEMDSILTFLTRDVGKKAGVLYGGKSVRSGNAAKAEMFVLNHLEFSEKPGSDLPAIFFDSYDADFCISFSKKITERYCVPTSPPCRLRVVGSWQRQNHSSKVS